MKIFVAGAVGLPLVRPLCTLGHQATGMTRADPGVDRLRELRRLGRRRRRIRSEGGARCDRGGGTGRGDRPDAIFGSIDVLVTRPNIPVRGYCFIAAITFEKDLPSEAADGAPVRERNLPDQSASAVGHAETVHKQVQKLQQHACSPSSARAGATQRSPPLWPAIEAHDNGVWLVGSSPRRCLRSRTGHPDLTPRLLTSEVRRKT
jgi:hypothetical protein